MSGKELISSLQNRDLKNKKNRLTNQKMNKGHTQALHRKRNTNMKICSALVTTREMLPANKPTN